LSTLVLGASLLLLMLGGIFSARAARRGQGAIDVKALA
jgi:hypothetical protein